MDPTPGAARACVGRHEAAVVFMARRPRGLTELAGLPMGAAMSPAAPPPALRPGREMPR
jgi:hypothetical protein